MAFYGLSLAWRTVPIGIAYAIRSGAGIARISLIGWVAFRQSLNAAAIIGIGLIVTGVRVVQVFSRTAAH